MGKVAKVSPLRGWQPTSLREIGLYDQKSPGIHLGSSGEGAGLGAVLDRTKGRYDERKLRVGSVKC